MKQKTGEMTLGAIAIGQSLVIVGALAWLALFAASKQSAARLEAGQAQHQAGLLAQMRWRSLVTDARFFSSLRAGDRFSVSYDGRKMICHTFGRLEAGYGSGFLNVVTRGADGSELIIAYDGSQSGLQKGCLPGAQSI